MGKIVSQALSLYTIIDFVNQHKNIRGTVILAEVLRITALGGLLELRG
jgi:hypothetical protein